VRSTWDLLLDEALRANREQQHELEVLRGRASLLIAATTPAGAVLSARSHPHHGVKVVAWWCAVSGVGVAAVIALVLALQILRRREWDFRPDLMELVEKADEENTTVEVLQRGMVVRFKKSWDANQQQLNQLLNHFTRGLVVLVVEYGLTFLANGAAQ
jgi:hypothetical protein